MQETHEEETLERPWEELERLVETATSPEVAAYLNSLSAGEVARALSRLSETDQTQLLETLPPERAAHLLEEVPHVQATDMLGNVSPEVAAAIVQELRSDERADLLGDLPEDGAAAILDNLPTAEADSIRELVKYDDDEAGGIMVTEFLAFRSHLTAEQVIENLRQNVETYRGFQSQYVYVTERGRKLSGVLQLRNLMLAPRDQRIHDFMVPGPLCVNHHTPLRELREFFDKHSYLAVPVVNDDQVLVGVVTRFDLREAIGEQADDDYRKSQGLVEEEMRTMPVIVRSRRRLAWLSVNIVLNVVAASVIAFYQDTLASVIALAVFLPIISDMSGCSGNQAVAVSMRELTMGLVRPNELLRVWLKELSVGALNGLALGSLIAAVAWGWKGNPYLGLVVGGAMAVNTVVAVSIGGLVPLLLKRGNMDPALASGPILTTITDMCGFFLVLSLASWLLPYLQ
mgnify:CR=1 FL=1